MKLTISHIGFFLATAVSAARRERDGWGGNGGFGFGDSCLNSCLTSHLSISLPTERPTATSDYSSHITAYSSAMSSLCLGTFPTATAAIESCLTASCTGTNSRTWDASYPKSLCSAYRSCASASASDAACAGWYGYGYGHGMGSWGGDRGPGGHSGDGNSSEHGRGGGPWGGWGHSKGPDGYYRVAPSGTCTDGLVTSTATVTTTLTDTQGVVQTSVGEEIRTGTVVRLEEAGTAAPAPTSTVGIPLASVTAAAAHLGVQAAVALAGLAVGAIVVL